MSSPSTILDPDPLTEAVDAERLLWDLHQRRRNDWLPVRNAAVRRCIAVGHSTEEIAEALAMRQADVERILLRTV